MLSFRLCAQQTYTDGTFNLSDWSVSTSISGVGGSMAAEQVTADGNPGSFRRVVNTVASESVVRGYHLNSLMTYSLETLGVPETIGYSFDYQVPDGWEVGIGLLVSQGTNLFLGGYTIVSGDTWQSQSVIKVARSQFQSLTGGELDFSANAAPLKFGFASVNSQGIGPGYEAALHIDNFSVTVLPPPRLNIALADPQQLRLGWSTNSTGYTLQASTSLTAPDWTAVTDPVANVGEQFIVNVANNVASRFFRLIKP